MRFDKANLQIISMLNKTIPGTARPGDVVILGRAGYAALQVYVAVLRARIQAPCSLRAQRIMAAEINENIESAPSLVASNDRTRAMFGQGFHVAGFHTTNQFHMVLDAGVVPDGRATAWIAQAARTGADRSRADALTTQYVEVNPLLAGTIYEVLDND